jgi:hypothetical protein
LALSAIRKQKKGIPNFSSLLNIIPDFAVDVVARRRKPQ